MCLPATWANNIEPGSAKTASTKISSMTIGSVFNLDMGRFRRLTKSRTTLVARFTPFSVPQDPGLGICHESTAKREGNGAAS